MRATTEDLRDYIIKLELKANDVLFVDADSVDVRALVETCMTVPLDFEVAVIPVVQMQGRRLQDCVAILSGGAA